jgi:hypothetical protein
MPPVSGLLLERWYMLSLSAAPLVSQPWTLEPLTPPACFTTLRTTKPSVGVLLLERDLLRFSPVSPGEPDLDRNQLVI